MEIFNNDHICCEDLLEDADDDNDGLNDTLDLRSFGY